ncbi:MAG: helix-turn-helix domain-containing protein [Caldisphaeraceae archaeon]|nr:helix-turn-helix domain-containing protein [Caldisphaeraceae archaeon]
MLSYKFHMYPSKTVQAKLMEQLELCRWLYNRLLFELNSAKEEGKKLRQNDT